MTIPRDEEYFSTGIGRLEIPIKNDQRDIERLMCRNCHKLTLWRNYFMIVMYNNQNTYLLHLFTVITLI